MYIRIRGTLGVLLVWERVEDVVMVGSDSAGRRLEPVAKKLSIDCKIINLSRTGEKEG